MFCVECGAEISDNAVVCPQCGVPVAGKGFDANGKPLVHNHMVAAVLTTIFCCVIGGVIAMLYAAQVNTKLAQGDIAGAQSAARTAMGWIIANLLLGLLIAICYVIQAFAVASGV